MQRDCIQPKSKQEAFSFLLFHDTEMFISDIVVGILLLTIVQTFTGKGLSLFVQAYQPAGNINANAPELSYVPTDTSKLTIRLLTQRARLLQP